MIKGKTLTKRDVFNKPRGDKKIGSIDANVDILASENKFQWLHLVDGGWVSAGAQQQYIKWEVVSEPPEMPQPEPETKKYIIGTTLTKRDIFNKPKGDKKVGTLEANTVIFATENKYQWLHLINGGWVSAGSKQQYIEWDVTSGSPETPPTDPPTTGEIQKIIKGKTLVKRVVVDKPRSKIKIRTLGANVDIVASENKYQWLHLTDGGWVNAGRRQQYIKWETVEEPVDTTPPSGPPDPIVTPLPPKEPWPITDIKRAGRIATLLVDWQNPKWNYKPRQFSLEDTMAYPQTVTFNSIPARMKGSTIPLTDQMIAYLVSLNGEKTKDLILTTGVGWINVPTLPGTVERLTWAGNHVIVKETRVVQEVAYANVHAISCYETDLIGNFFDKDMRLVLHKFNAVTRASNMIKLANARDCYTPFITDPNVNNGDMWIPVEYLEMWPELPFTLSDGTQIIEYELFGHKTYGLREDGKSILLRDPDGFKTDWRIISPEVPI